MAATEIEIYQKLNVPKSKKEAQTAKSKQKAEVILKHSEAESEPQQNPTAVDKIVSDLLEKPYLKHFTKTPEGKAVLQQVFSSLMADTDLMQTLKGDKTIENKTVAEEKRLRMKAEREVLLLKQSQKVREQQLEELKEELLANFSSRQKANVDVPTLWEFVLQEREDRLSLQNQLDQNTDFIKKLNDKVKTYEKTLKIFQERGLEQKINKLQSNQQGLMEWLGATRDQEKVLVDSEANDYHP